VPADPAEPCAAAAGYGSTPLAEALSLDRSCQETMLFSLGIKVSTRHEIYPDRPDIQNWGQGKPFGKIQFVLGHALKCVCRLHPSCALFLNAASGRVVEVTNVMIAWQCAGFGQTPDQHATLRTQVANMYSKKRGKAAGGNNTEKCMLWQPRSILACHILSGVGKQQGDSREPGDSQELGGNDRRTDILDSVSDLWGTPSVSF
jgi:hypothetical protein